MEFDAIFLAGPQGSGKGTQGKRLAQKLGFLFWEMGKMLRDISHEDSPLGKKVSVMNDGVLLTDEVIMEVLQDRLPPVMTPGQGIVFDGVPRRLGQAKFLVEFLREQKMDRMETIFIELPREECIRRLTLRSQHESRKDDTPEGIETRFRFYDDAMKPAMDYLKTQTKFISVDGVGDPAVVFDRISSALR